MKSPESSSRPLVTRLLLLPDGSVLADNLTPAMAEVLRGINLPPDTATQSSLSNGVRGRPAGKTIVSPGCTGDTPRNP